MNEFNEIPLSEEQINQLYQEFRQRARIEDDITDRERRWIRRRLAVFGYSNAKLSIKKQEKLQQELFTSQQASNILLKKKSQTKSWRSLYGKRFLENIRSKGPAQNNQYWGFPWANQSQPVSVPQLAYKTRLISPFTNVPLIVCINKEEFFKIPCEI